MSERTFSPTGRQGVDHPRRRGDTDRPRSGLYADALRVLTGWRPPDDTAAATRDRFLALLTAEPDAVRRDHPGAHLTASTMVVDPTGERVLLCLHGRFGVWVQLGGHCEASDTTMCDAARREATEESGIDGLVLSADPIGLDIHPVHCAAGASLHYDVRYAALAPPGAALRVSAESRDLAWFLPDALPGPLAGATEPLVAPALAWAASELGRVIRDAPSDAFGAIPGVVRRRSTGI